MDIISIQPQKKTLKKMKKNTPLKNQKVMQKSTMNYDCLQRYQKRVSIGCAHQRH